MTFQLFTLYLNLYSKRLSNSFFKSPYDIQQCRFFFHLGTLILGWQNILLLISNICTWFSQVFINTYPDKENRHCCFCTPATFLFFCWFYTIFGSSCSASLTTCSYFVTFILFVRSNNTLLQTEREFILKCNHFL